MKLSVVIPTKNEESNISSCIRAFDAVREEVEVIVVDNASTDATKRIAAERGAKVLDKGPERSAQRNLGWREATGEYVMFVDADMIVPEETVREIIECSNNRTFECCWVPEVRTGTGLRLKARNFERSFYNGTCIDGFRVIRRELLEKVGGYDETLVACEDWDLDRRLLASGVRTAITKGHLLHNEARQTLRTLLGKKAYYSSFVAVYRKKWGDDEICRKQFGLYYRFLGVFIENGKWRRMIKHPILAFVMYFERFTIGLTYLLNR